MNYINYSKEFCDLAKKPKLSAEKERLAKIREHQRRERKEELYSYRPIKSLNL